jgi:uncharacterized protein (TIGR02246 family)
MQMKTALKLVLVLTCVSVVWAVQSKPAAAPDDQQKAIEKAVLEVHAKMAEAEKNRDIDKFFSFIPDFDKGCIIQDGVLFKTRQEALDAVKAGFQRLSKVERKYDQMYVTVISPEAALLTGTGTIAVTTSDGQTLGGPFAVSMVFVVRDGQWRLLQGHYSTPSPR